MPNYREVRNRYIDTKIIKEYTVNDVGMTNSTPVAPFHHHLRPFLLMLIVQYGFPLKPEALIFEKQWPLF